MGTGTTGASALKLNRRFIGADIDELYYVTAMDSGKCNPMTIFL